MIDTNSLESSGNKAYSSACLIGFALLMVVPGMAQEAPIAWPEKVIIEISPSSYCAGKEMLQEDLAFEFSKALASELVVLERGKVQKAIEDELREGMQATFDPVSTVDAGYFEGADGVAVLAVSCSSGQTKCAVTLSNVASGRRVYSESFVANDVTNALAMLSLDLELSKQEQGHEAFFAKYTQQQLKNSVFSLRDADVFAARKWESEAEYGLYRSLSSFVSKNELNVSSPISVSMTTNGFGSHFFEVQCDGMRERSLMQHVESELARSVGIEPIRYHQQNIQTQIQGEWSVFLLVNPELKIRYWGSPAEIREPFRGHLKQAPRGDYTFFSQELIVGNYEHDEVDLVRGTSRSMLTSLMCSSVVPGSGITFGTYGDSQLRYHPFVVYGFAIIGAICFQSSRSQYADYKIASTAEDAEILYSRANRMNQIALVSSGVSGLAWAWNLTDTYRKVHDHARQIREFMNR